MKKFKKIYIEITNTCNLACDFCPPTKRAGEFMEVEIFNTILDQIKGHTQYIYFHVKGEPLLHPNIDQLLDISHKKGFRVNITTNGTLIKKVKDKIMNKPALRQINFSLHSFDGNDGSEDKTEYVDSILSFIKEVENNNIIVSLRLWNLDKDNGTNIEKKRNREVLQRIEKDFGLKYQIEEKVVPGKGLKIRDQVYINQESEFQWPDLNLKEENSSGFCHGLRNQVAILVDGTVVPCCLDGEGIINLGNINTNLFAEIVESERANKMYNGFSNRQVVEELCKKCGYRKRFHL
ncbi:radical SAM protein with 4Fe4S-binding SPASM domain [Natranaerovirga hydrolytica]|uniref:Radical SAM protein with 4Fe4S-binding SPASM domain n=1 Tax=Natranaerovirga hydrolytica TaxID=680378 RepID=A0A4R1N608_9FIRM|nr:radical SAM/SPASM domain-containing protein [Natranaerovirga hydrolytica]TCK98063.1 radical SAM protein with 4Fe4S-binding SPASM domain [Natranaerovirga hydrolytica]